MSEMINLPVAEFQQLQAQKAEFEKLTAARELEAASANARLAISRGEVDNVVRQTRQEVAEANAKAARFAAKSELATALAGHQLNNGAAEQLGVILGSQISGELATDGTFIARTPTFQSVKDFVAAKLQDESFRHFLASGQPANRPATLGHPAQPGTPAAMPEPANLGQAVVLRAQMEREARANQGKADGRTDPSQPFGLGKGGPPAFGSLTNHLRGFR